MFYFLPQIKLTPIYQSMIFNSFQNLNPCLSSFISQMTLQIKNHRFYIYFSDLSNNGNNEKVELVINKSGT